MLPIVAVAVLTTLEPKPPPRPPRAGAELCVWGLQPAKSAVKRTATKAAWHPALPADRTRPVADWDDVASNIFWAMFNSIRSLQKCTFRQLALAALPRLSLFHAFSMQ
jgi:hypothetical protein